VTVHDWRAVPPGVFRRIYDAEALRWSLALHWDTRSNWTQVESARLADRLPGLVARDDGGRICGWTFYLLHNGALEIGAVASTSPEVTAALIDGALASPEGARASSVVLFVYSDAPGLEEHVRARGFAVERYLYLSADLGVGHACPTGGPFVAYDHGVHAAGVAALLASAYAHDDRTRPFARNNQPHEWVEYLGQLVTATGCGAFLPGVSFVAADARSARLEGATLVTRLAADTVHLAQIAVAPDAQGRGLAARLVDASLEAARTQGFARTTLLVGERNARARLLYERLGFRGSAGFVSAVCDQPTRSTSVALETGGAITLR
jgi:ribosomal protein S18 acetylase RimI-like enzyme